LQLDISVVACGESRSRPLPTSRLLQRRVEPTSAGSDSPTSEGSAGCGDRCGRCLRLAQISTWRRFNLPALSGIRRVDCGGQVFDPYSV